MKKFSKKTTAFILAVMMLLTFVPSISFADEPAAPMMILRMETDYFKAGDEVNAELWVYNATFNTAGFALKFDTQSVKLVDGEDFYESVVFEEYNKGEGIFNLWEQTAVTDNENGLVKGILYVSPMAQDAPSIVSPTNKDAREAKVGSDGYKLAEIKFSALKDGTADISFTTIKNDADFSDRAYALGYKGETPHDVELSVEYSETPKADAEEFAQTVKNIGEVTLEDEKAVNNAFSAYENLSALSKELAKEAKSELDEKKAALDKILAELGDEQIAEKFLSDLEALKNTEGDLAELETGLSTVKDAYAALTEAQKAIVDAKADVDDIFAQVQAKIDSEREAINLKNAKKAMQEIVEKGEVTIEDADAVKAAKALYDSLSDESKSQISADLVKALEDAVKKIEELEKDLIKPGDVNGDNFVNALDATQILRFANGKSSVLSGAEKDSVLYKAADVNSDGLVNALDATQILRYANGKSSVLTK